MMRGMGDGGGEHQLSTKVRPYSQKEVDVDKDETDGTHASSRPLNRSNTEPSKSLTFDDVCQEEDCEAASEGETCGKLHRGGVFCSQRRLLRRSPGGGGPARKSSRALKSEIETAKKFLKRECSTFVPTSAGGDKCKCGRLLKDHAKPFTSETDHNLPWSPVNNTRKDLTDAFGEIHFAGTPENKTAKYIRVEDQTNVNKLVDYAFKCWDLPQPKMIISITGGAQDFKMDKKRKDGFKKGLMKVAVSTGAWIVTGGTKAGIMRICGEAVQDHLTAHGEKDNPLVTIGVATWGCLNDKEHLVDAGGKFPAEYSGLTGKGSTLDPNHTHFFLVDDGTVMNFGREAALRGRLEAEICKHSQVKTDKGEVVKVPIVCICVEGGPGTLDTVAEAIENETPVVIMDGTGRIADVIAYAHRLLANSQTSKAEEETRVYNEDGEALVRRKLREMNPNEAKVTEWYNKIKTLFNTRRRYDLFTIFKLEGSSISDIDIAILKALLKVDSDKERQLKLALSWDRVDIARMEIFSGDNMLKGKNLHDSMTQAIGEYKKDFIQLFLENGVIMKEYLTPCILTKLYRDAYPKNKFLRDYFNSKLRGPGKEREELTLKTVGSMIKSFLGGNYNPLYHQNICPSEAQSGEAADPFNKPFANGNRELFVFSLLLQKENMTLFFWEEGTEQIAGALFACRILRHMAGHSLLKDDIEQQNKLRAIADEYEERAIGILNQCQEDDDEKTQKILIREQPNFGSLTCVDLAVIADSKKFIAHTGCQALFQSIWMGRIMPYTSKLRFLAAVFFPPAILSLEFTERSKEHQTTPQITQKHSSASSPEKQVVDNLEDENQIEVGGGEKLTWRKKFSRFYTAPVTKFTLNLITYMVFLFLFSFFVLSKYPENAFNYLEGILIIWVFSFAIEEFRQLLVEDSENFKKKMTSYISNFWNWLDLGALLLFLAGVIARLLAFYVVEGGAGQADFVNVAHTLYVFSLVVYYIRLTHTCSVHKQLGPKVIMIGKMMQDLMFFLFILMVFLISYGVAVQSLMFPNTQEWTLIFRGIFYYPYWQMFGELFLEDIGVQTDRCIEEGQSHLYCSQPDHVDNTIMFLAVCYLFFTNIVLVNLLIAMFSYTFERVQENTDLYWKFHLFELIKEYFQRPALPPPFILLAHIKFFIQLMLSNCCSKFKRPDYSFMGTVRSNIMRPYQMTTLQDPQIHQLIKWEDLNAEEYMRELERTERGTQEAKVIATQANTEKLLMLIDNGNDDDNQSLAQRVASLDEKVSQLTANLESTQQLVAWIADSLGRIAEATPPSAAGPTSFTGLSKQPKAASSGVQLPTRPDLRQHSLALGAASAAAAAVDKKAHSPREETQMPAAKSPRLKDPPGPHKKARTQSYEKDGVKRLEFKDEFVRWTRNIDGYKPPVYTHATVRAGPVWADPEFTLDEHKKKAADVAWNEIDKKYKVDRRTFEKVGKYDLARPTPDIDVLLPRNPRGRTGLAGRGLLGRYGPNHAADPVVTRWKTDENGSQVKCGGKPVLEFVAIQRGDTGEWAIPGGMVDMGENVSQTLMREFMEEALNDPVMAKLSKTDRKEKLMELFGKSNQKEVYRGYVDDPRNTDNAWMETVVVNFHDDKEMMKDIKLEGGDDARKARWMAIDCNLTDLYASHSEFVKEVAEIKGAFCPPEK